MLVMCLDSARGWRSRTSTDINVFRNGYLTSLTLHTSQHQNQAVSNSNLKIKRMSDATNCTSLQCKLQRCKTTDDVNPRVNVRFSGIFWSGHSRRMWTPVRRALGFHKRRNQAGEGLLSDVFGILLFHLHALSVAMIKPHQLNPRLSPSCR